MFVLIAVVFAQDVSVPNPKWEKEIAGIQRRIAKEKPAAGGIVFFGSSTIRLWDVKESFPGRRTFNAGFGGSTYRDAADYVERAVLPAKPGVLVLYSGDNDVAAGRAPAEILADFVRLTKKLRTKLPNAKIVVLGIKPSPKRWEMWSKMEDTNERIEAACAKLGDAVFVDLAPSLMDSEGAPDRKFFKEDELHLNAMGYAEVAKLVEKALPPAQAP